MIKSFEHKGLRRLFETGNARGVRPAHVNRLIIQMNTLDEAVEPADMDFPGWELHPLRGNLAGKWAVKVNANWRLVFEMEGGHAYVVDYEDYH